MRLYYEILVYSVFLITSYTMSIHKDKPSPGDYTFYDLGCLIGNNKRWYDVTQQGRDFMRKWYVTRAEFRYPLLKYLPKEQLGKVINKNCVHTECDDEADNFLNDLDCFESNAQKHIQSYINNLAEYEGCVIFGDCTSYLLDQQYKTIQKSILPFYLWQRIDKVLNDIFEYKEDN